MRGDEGGGDRGNWRYGIEGEKEGPVERGVMKGVWTGGNWRYGIEGEKEGRDKR
jgi:hypothetical protein